MEMTGLPLWRFIEELVAILFLFGKDCFAFAAGYAHYIYAASNILN
jgi:hypothetical protein